MRTEPRAESLIRRICDSLEKTALADMTGPLAARQLKAGLWTLRRIAGSTDFATDLLAEEIADIEAVLEHRAELPDTLDARRARHVLLQARLIEADRRAQAACASGTAGADDDVRALRSLYRRMLARERASPGS